MRLGAAGLSCCGFSARRRRKHQLLRLQCERAPQALQYVLVVEVSVRLHALLANPHHCIALCALR